MNDDGEFVPTNDTAAALLRKLEDGTFLNYAGGEVQRLLSHLRALAAKKNGRAVGEVTIKIKIPMGKDGYALPIATLKCKAPEMARDETMIFVDEEGDLMSRPVEKQLVMKGIDGGAAAAAAPANEPKKPASKGM